MTLPPVAPIAFIAPISPICSEITAASVFATRNEAITRPTIEKTVISVTSASSCFLPT